MIRVASIGWRRLDVPGHDACALWQTADGWRLAGSAAFTIDEQRCQLSYVVECDPAWRTRAAAVDGSRGREALSIVIAALPGGRWSVNGAKLRAARSAGARRLKSPP